MLHYVHHPYRVRQQHQYVWLLHVVHQVYDHYYCTCIHMLYNVLVLVLYHLPASFLHDPSYSYEASCVKSSWYFFVAKGSS